MHTTIDLPNETVNLHDLVRRAVAGDEIIISEAGMPLVRLVAITAPPPDVHRRTAGLSEGTARIAPDFDAPLPDAFWVGDA